MTKTFSGESQSETEANANRWIREQGDRIQDVHMSTRVQRAPKAPHLGLIDAMGFITTVTYKMK